MKASRVKKHRLVAAIACLTLVLAWIAGGMLQTADHAAVLTKIVPSADRFDTVAAETYAIHQQGQTVGLVGFGAADGYGGPLQVAVAVDLAGSVIAVEVAAHKETPSYMERVVQDDVMAQLRGLSDPSSLRLGIDIDAVTGATYTTRAVVESTAAAWRSIAADQLGIAVSQPEPPSIQFGIPEWVLIALYAAGFFGHRRRFKHKKLLRWGMLLTGMIVLGFWFNVPLTLSRINSFLLGYWPQWQTNLYWYLLLGGLLVVATVDNKNAYCSWFCPFGAVQDCMGAVGGAKAISRWRYRRFFIQVQRGLAWLAIALALLFRNPGVSSYEVFGTLFSLTGSSALFALLGLILMMSLFVKRPWCHFLCPLNPVYDVIRLLRGWLRELWLQIKTKPDR